MRRTGGSFRGLMTYLTSSRGHAERLGRVRLANCVSTDIASAVLEVESVQARNRRARHNTYHLILAFPAGEEPTGKVLAGIERRACEALGFVEHQRVSVVHHDTDHLHLHVAINRVHPKTHRVHWPSYSKLVLDRLCVDVEDEHGLRPVHHRTRERTAHLEASEALRAFLKGSCAEPLRQARTWAELHELAQTHGVQLQLRANGLAFVGQAGSTVRTSSVARDLSKRELERRLGRFEGSGQAAYTADGEQSTPSPRRVPDSERAGGVETLIGWIQRECAESFRGARSWGELHEAAAARGLCLKLRGNGLVVVARDGLATKASSVARDLSKTALEAQLGAFEPAGTTVQLARTEYRRQPLARNERTSQLYEQYRQEREGASMARARAVAELRQQRGWDQEGLKRISQRRWAAVRLVAKGRVAWALWGAYARQADRRDRQRAGARYRAAVRAAAARHPRIGWKEWLQNRAENARVADAAALPITFADSRLEQRRLELLNHNEEHADGQRRARGPRHSTGSTGAAERPGARSAGAGGVRKPYGGQPRAGTTPKALADLRDLSALPVVRFDRSPQVLLPTHARRNVEQRGTEQPDLGVRRDPAQRRIGESARQQGWRKRR